jgi:hypothetical protein
MRRLFFAEGSCAAALADLETDIKSADLEYERDPEHGTAGGVTLTFKSEGGCSNALALCDYSKLRPQMI